MSTEEFVKHFCDLLYTAHGWDEPLTMERLCRLLQQSLAELDEVVTSN